MRLPRRAFPLIPTQVSNVTKANPAAQKIPQITTAEAVPRSFRRRACWHAVAAAALALAGSEAAYADAFDTVSAILGAGMRYEDNLFRLPSSTDPQTLSGRPSKSDTIYSVLAGLKVDQPYSLQRFQFDLTATHYEYQDNKALSFTGVDYRGAWLWRVTPYVSGSLSADRAQRGVDYADYRNQIGGRNVLTTENRNFTIDGDVGSGWHGVGGLAQSRSRSQQVFNPIGNYVTNSAEAGVRYVSGLENSVTLLGRKSNGEYQERGLDVTNLLDTRFDQREVEGRVVWHASAHSIFNLRLGRLERTHEHFSQRNFSGTVGQLDYTWMPRSKLQILTTAARNLYSFQEASNSYYVADTIAVAPTWLFSDKTTFRARLDLTRRDYQGAIVPTATMRQDRNRTFQLGADWRASRDILVTASYQREYRSANLPGLDYSANVLGVTAQIAF